MTISAPDLLEIPGTALAAILKAAAEAWPCECCGVLVGSREKGRIRVTRAVAARNVARDRGRAFEVDPRTLLATHRESREAGEEILGPFHSHPDGSALPSRTDASRAVGVGECWLIVPVKGGTASIRGTGDPRAFLFDGEAFGEIRIQVTA